MGREEDTIRRGCDCAGRARPWVERVEGGEEAAAEEEEAQPSGVGARATDGQGGTGRE